jgi:hypothetical protein
MNEELNNRLGQDVPRGPDDGEPHEGATEAPPDDVAPEVADVVAQSAMAPGAPGIGDTIEEPEPQTAEDAGGDASQEDPAARQFKWPSLEELDLYIYRANRAWEITKAAMLMARQEINADKQATGSSQATGHASAQLDVQSLALSFLLKAEAQLRETPRTEPEAEPPADAKPAEPVQPAVSAPGGGGDDGGGLNAVAQQPVDPLQTRPLPSASGSFSAGLLAATTFMPGVMLGAMAIDFVVWHGNYSSLLVGGAVMLATWFVAAMIAMPYTSVRQANTTSFRELQARVQGLDRTIASYEDALKSSKKEVDDAPALKAALDEAKRLRDDLARVLS